MRERRVPTLADARRQALVRGVIGWLLIPLTGIFLGLFVVKELYLNLPHDLVFSKQGKDLRQFIDLLLEDWRILDLLWRAMPPWQPRPLSPTTLSWEYMYALWGASAVGSLGGLLVRSAHKRRAQIAAFQDEMQREAWREQARAARGVAPHARGAAPVIEPATWQQYAAPSEPWSQTVGGVLILGLIITVVSGLLVGGVVLYAEYSFFQVHLPPSRN
jgi:hypothetical protein